MDCFRSPRPGLVSRLYDFAAPVTITVTGQNSRILSQRLVPCQPLASACFVVTLRLLDTDRHDVDNPFDRLVREAPVTCGFGSGLLQGNGT
jgi:hypothetical protein